MTDERVRDTASVADFVRRLRRVALHPLARDDGVGEEMPMPGDRLRKLMKVEIKAEVRSDGTATLRSLLPDEVQFESLAPRVRAFTLPKDRLYSRKGLDAVDRLTGLGDMAIRLSSRDLRPGGRRQPTGPRGRGLLEQLRGREERRGWARSIHRHRPGVCLALPGRGPRGRGLHRPLRGEGAVPGSGRGVRPHGGGRNRGRP